MQPLDQTRVMLRWALAGLFLALAMIAWSILTMHQRAGVTRREPPAVMRAAPVLRPEPQSAPPRTRLGPLPPTRALAAPWVLPEPTHPPLLAPWQKKAAPAPSRVTRRPPQDASAPSAEEEDENDVGAGLIWFIPAVGNTPFEGGAFND